MKADFRCFIEVTFPLKPTPQDSVHERDVPHRHIWTRELQGQE